VSDNEDEPGKATTRRSKKPAANNKNKDSDNDTGDDSSDDSEDDDDVQPDVTKPRPAKVIAGEVIKQWQSKTRSRGCMHFSYEN